MRCSLMGFSCCGFDVKNGTSAYSSARRCPALSDCEARPALCPKCEFWCKLEEVQQCQRGWVSSEHTEHIPEGSGGCDFSRLSQGLGYSVCLCELMLLLSQCLSSPVKLWYYLFPQRERQGSIIVLLGLFRLYSIQLLWHIIFTRNLWCQPGRSEPLTAMHAEH